MNSIFELFSYTFMVRAFFAGLFIAFSAALLGLTLVLRRYSMIADGLSHTGFGALALAAAFNAAPLFLAMPASVACAYFLLKGRGRRRIAGDAAIALISAASFSAGVIIAAKTGLNTDINNYLFGSILALKQTDVYLCAALALITGLVFIVCCHKIFALSFDPSFLRASGIRTGVYDSILSVLTALTIVLGMRMIGALLMSGLIVVPVVSAMCFAKTYKRVTIVSCILSEACFLTGLFTSYIFSLPTGAAIVAVNIACYVMCYAVSRLLRR